MKKSKIFWGLFFILAAVYVVISKLGILPDVGVFNILFTVFLIWMLIEGIRRISFYEILFSIAFFCIVYKEALPIPTLSSWTILAAALLGSIGLSMLFGDLGKKRRIEEMERMGFAGSDSAQCMGEQLKIENSFGSAIRYINSDNFKNAQIENNFGALAVYFDNAMIQDGSAAVNVENNFGETNLYIPKEWQVNNNLERAFGAINQSGTYMGNSSTVLYMNGSANFGAINIHYV